MAEQKESSVLFSLKELMNLEEDRIRQEDDEKRKRAEAEVQARQELLVLRHHRLPADRLISLDQVDEVVRAQDDEDGEHHVRDGGREVDVQLFLRDGDGVAHWF